MDFITSPIFWIKFIQFILSISFLVLIHEAGHCIVAKLNHVRVEKFYMFFNAGFSLFRMKKFDGRWHFRFLCRNEEKDEWVTKEPDNTIWGIGWLPLGGYCAIAGMVDETHDANELSKEAQPWEFRSKNVWQRLSIIIAGITVNFIAALILFAAIFYSWGETVLPLKNATNGLYFDEVFLNEGFEQGDQILLIDSVAPYTLSEAVNSLLIDGQRNVVVQRGEEQVALTLSKDFGQKFLAAQQAFDKIEREHKHRDKTYTKRRYVPIAEAMPMIVDSVIPMHAGAFAGLMKGDTIQAIDGVRTPTVSEVQNELAKHPYDSITIVVAGADGGRELNAFIGEHTELGIVMVGSYAYFRYETREYGFWESVPKGIAHGWSVLVDYVKQFKLVFTKEGAQSLGGFVAIGDLFPSMWSWHAFWNMTAFLSIILAFMNFLPIPALDGGYILFLIVEMITGKQPSDKFLEKANNVGFWLLIILLIFANGNDLFKAFF